MKAACKGSEGLLWCEIPYVGLLMGESVGNIGGVGAVSDTALSLAWPAPEDLGRWVPLVGDAP